MTRVLKSYKSSVPACLNFNCLARVYVFIRWLAFINSDLVIKNPVM
jgi:hypothetical protein